MCLSNTGIPQLASLLLHLEAEAGWEYRDHQTSHSDSWAAVSPCCIAGPSFDPTSDSGSECLVSGAAGPGPPIPAQCRSIPRCPVAVSKRWNQAKGL